MANTESLIEAALKMGFSAAAVMETMELTIVPEYRKYCEQNLCGRYDVLSVCPPKCGTVEDMVRKLKKYCFAFILQTTVSPSEAEQRKEQPLHNEMAEKLMEHLSEYGIGEYLFLSAGPWKEWSCMSAYCIDAQKMAEHVGMLCWANDGLYRFFSLILYN